MQELSRSERLDAVKDVIGTHRAEGIVIDPSVQELMEEFIEGRLSLDEFSARVDVYANQLAGDQRQKAVAA
jgi:hypothetical protein